MFSVSGAQSEEPCSRRCRNASSTGYAQEALDSYRRAALGENISRIARGLVFPSKKSGGHHTASFLAKPFARRRKRVGVGIRFTPQGMRRTANNLRGQLGIDRTVIQDEIGHASDRMTDRYSNVTVDEKRDAIERLVQAIDGASDSAEVAPGGFRRGRAASAGRQEGSPDR